MMPQLENRLVIGAAAHYDALTEEPTREEEEAMDQLTRQRKARDYAAALKQISDVSFPVFIDQVFSAAHEAADMKDGFVPILMEAVARRDDNLVGKILMRAIEMYWHNLAAQEVGVS